MLKTIENKARAAGFATNPYTKGVLLIQRVDEAGNSFDRESSLQSIKNDCEAIGLRTEFLTEHLRQPLAPYETILKVSA